MFLGSPDSVAATLVVQAGQRFVPVPGSPIRKADVIGLARAAQHTLHAIVVARRILRDHRTQVVMGFGGFASGGVLLAARTLGLPTAILEANVELGLANRWLRPWMTRTFQGLGTPHASITGVPVRRSVVSAVDQSVRPPHDTLRILVASGSRGADFFAARLPQILHRMRASGVPLEVRQQASAPDALRKRYKALSVDATVDAFVSDIGSAYTWADVVIARGGANTIAELALAGLPALLVPLADAAANHQAANAALWQHAGAGLAIPEHKWRDETVATWLTTMAMDLDARARAAGAARTLALPDAATRIAEECVRLTRRSP